MDFDGKTVLITGAGSGIGAETASLFAQSGAKVLASDINAGGLEQTVSGLGDRARAFVADVTDEDQVKAMVAAAADGGGLDVAVNCAGLDQQPASFEAIPAEAFDAVMAVNARGVFLGMKHQLAAMLDAGTGSIVNVASVTGLVGSPMMAAYVASKHAVIGMTKSAALDVAARGVRVNAVCPGGTLTPMLEELAAQSPEIGAFVEHGKAQHPMGRMASPREIADAIVYLASDRASFMTGAALPVDGGYTAP